VASLPIPLVDGMNHEPLEKIVQRSVRDVARFGLWLRAVYTKGYFYLLALGGRPMQLLSLRTQDRRRLLRGWCQNYSSWVLCWLLLLVGISHASQLTLKWEDNADNETGFRVERRAEGTNEFQWLTALDADANSYVDKAVAGGKSYCYRVQAYNPLGASGYSNESCAKVSTLLLGVENPEVDQVVSGISAIRGWAFDSVGGRKIDRVELFVDGSLVGDVPCCSPRGDVQSIYSQFPADNTTNSGWGTGVNWSDLPPGPHTVQIKIKGVSGETISSETRQVKVIRPGTSAFVDVFSLSRASTQVNGQELILQNVIVRDKATQQQSDVTATFRWLTNAQAFGMTQAFTVSNTAASQSSLLARVGAQMRRWWNESMLSVSSAYAASKIVALIESPDNGQVVFGVNVFRGWAFDEDPNVTIRSIRFTVDDTPVTTIPCCAGRADVAAMFSTIANAGKSGWGITLNYANLPAGSHTVGVQIESSAGVTFSTSRQVNVVKLPGFEFLDLVDFTVATVRIEGDDIVVSGVRIRDAASQRTTTVQLRLRWSFNSQTLGVVAIS